MKIKLIIEFVKGNNLVKEARHMKLRMWHTRDEYATGKYELLRMDGKELPADMLTKPGNLKQDIKFTRVRIITLYLFQRSECSE